MDSFSTKEAAEECVDYYKSKKNDDGERYAYSIVESELFSTFVRPE